MKEYEVWSEGYACTGQSAPHEYIGKAKAHSFREAGRIVMKEHLGDEYKEYYDPIRNTYWGCNLYPTEEQSAKTFG